MKRKIWSMIIALVMIIGMSCVVQAAENEDIPTVYLSGYTVMGSYDGHLAFCEDEVRAGLSTSPYSSAEPMYTKVTVMVYGYEMYPSFTVSREGWGSCYYSNASILAIGAVCDYYVDYEYKDSLSLMV